MKKALSLHGINLNKNKDMKKIVIILLISGLISSDRIFSQEKENSRIPLLGEMSPEFTAQSTMGKIHFPNDYYMKWKILFSHPADFTPVCSTEILHLAAVQDEFEKLDAKLLVISTDGLNSHIAWVKSLETISYPGSTPVKIKFPLISDSDLKISKKFGMIHSYTSSTRDVRGVFIIDPNDRVSAVFFYPNNIGRNIDEIKRTLIALQTAEKHNVLTPANWVPGNPVLEIPKTEQKEVSQKEKQSKQPDSAFPWYVIFRNLR